MDGLRVPRWRSDRPRGWRSVPLRSGPCPLSYPWWRLQADGRLLARAPPVLLTLGHCPRASRVQPANTLSIARPILAHSPRAAVVRALQHKTLTFMLIRPVAGTWRAVFAS